MDEAKRARVIEARMKLRERFRSHETPSMADATPLGSGPPNRHGMPQLPPDQIATTKWPVLDLGQKPEIAKVRWKLTVDGACRRPLALDWKTDVLLVHTADGQPLPVEHGGPVRVVTPQLYAWKGANWVNRIELMIVDRPGFWEERGYSNTAYPWRNDRYS